jgi:hypothetical protein
MPASSRSMFVHLAIQLGYIKAITYPDEIFSARSHPQRCLLQISIDREASATKIHLWIDRDTEEFGLRRSSSVSHADDLKNRKPD